MNTKLLHFPDKPVHIPSGAYRAEIHFKYDHKPCRKVKGLGCYIVLDLLDGRKIPWTVMGFSYCNPNDIFVKEIGRKTALTRALSRLTTGDFDKDRGLRTMFWDMYHSRELQAEVVID